MIRNFVFKIKSPEMYKTSGLKYSQFIAFISYTDSASTIILLSLFSTTPPLMSKKSSCPFSSITFICPLSRIAMISVVVFNFKRSDIPWQPYQFNFARINLFVWCNYFEKHVIQCFRFVPDVDRYLASASNFSPFSMACSMFPTRLKAASGY